MSMNISEDSAWVVTSDVDSLPGKGSTFWHGYVYVVQYGNGIKIGHTANLKERVRTILAGAANYSDVKTGRIAYTREHTNHKEIETQLHKHFSSRRLGRSERFGLTLDEFLDEAPCVKLLDESAQKQARSDALSGALMNFVLGNRRQG